MKGTLLNSEWARMSCYVNVGKSLSQGADEGADRFAVGAEGEDGEGTFVVLWVEAMAVGGFEEVDLRGAEVEGLCDTGNLWGGKGETVV